MEKKFFDIIPPKKEEKPLYKEKKVKKSFKMNRMLFYSFLVVFLFLLVVFSVRSFSSPILIQVIPEVTSLEIQETINLDSEIEHTVYTTNTVAVRRLEENKKESQEFLATGKQLVEEKASGTIRVYNEHSTENQPLVANTRFISSDGELFRSVQAETIPGGSYEGTKLVPGHLDIEVVAAEAGPEYNIKPSTFSIPGFAGTARYTTFFGKSYEKMEGGVRQEKSQVTQEDLNEAERQLITRLEKEVKESLLEKTPQGFSLIIPSISYQVLEASSMVEAGAVQESFSFETELKATGLILKESEIKDLIRSFASEELEGMLIKEDSLTINYESLEEEELKATFVLEVYPEIDILELKRMVVLKSSEEAKNELQKKDVVSEVEIKSWSFLRRRAPESLEKIEIEIKVD